MGHEELIRKMRGRINECRQLAASTTDARTAKILRDMADEGERDVEKLEAEQHPITIVIKPEALGT